MDVFELYAKLGLDKTEYEKGLDDAKGQADKAGGGIGQAIGNGMKVVAGAAAAAAAAVTAFAGTSVKTGMEFDTAMSQVAATMGKTTEELANEVGTTETSFGHFEGSLRDFAQFLGSNTAFSATQAAEALNYMALAGYEAQDSMDMLPNVLSLAAAGGIDLASASDMVTDAQSALGLTAEETAELVDKMAMASSKTNTSVGQLGEAILTVGGTAKNMAGGTTELTQVLGLLADNGIKGAEGGTALRNMILSLSAPTDQAAKLMKELGLEVFDAQGNMRPLNDIFGDLNDKLATMTQEGRTNVLNEIFNKVDLKSANALLGTSAERWDQVAAAIDNAQGAAAKMADTQLDNLAGDITLFQSALEGAKIAISDALTPALREFVQFATEKLGELTIAIRDGALSEALSSLKDGFSRIKEAISPLTEEIKSLAASEDSATNASNLLKGAFDLFIEALHLGAEALAFVLEKGAQFLGWLNGGSAGAEAFKAAVVALVAGIATFEIITTVVGWVKAATTAFSLFNAVLLANPIGLVIAAIAALVAAFVYLWNNNEEFRKFWINLWDKVSSWAKEKIEEIKATFELLKAAFGLVRDWFRDKINDIKSKWQELKDDIHEKGEAIKNKWNDIKNAFVSAWETIKKFFTNDIPNTFNKAVNFLAALPKKALKWGTDLLTQFGKGIEEKVEDIIQMGRDIVTNVKNGFAESVSDALNWGRDLISNFIKGIKNGWNDLKGTLGDFADKIADFIGFSEPKEGPLSRFHTFAPDMMKLFAQGIKENEGLVTAQINKSFDFGGNIMGASPALAAGPTTNTWNITVNGIDELEEIVRWYQGRQVEERMR